MGIFQILLASCVVLLIALSASAGNKSGIINSPHNLSASGTGPITSSQDQVCIFCHAPHNAQVDVKPLWNHAMPTTTYSTYTSSTMQAAKAAAPGLPSKQCLSCHDGTIGMIGQTTANGTITTTGALTATGNLGADLTNDHPISFNMVDDGQLSSKLFLTPPSTADSTVKLRNGLIECVTCHDPHTPNTDPVAQNFLVRSNAGSALCLACHDVSRPQPNILNGWTAGAHGNSTTSVTGTGALFGEYGTVNANACINCHMPHNASAGAAARMLRGPEESACGQCHSGANLSPVLLSIMAEFTKTYSHPTTKVSGAHDAVEVAPLNGTRHAECADCHNSHAAAGTGGSTAPPALQSALLGTSGVDATGTTQVRPAANEYQICFKCHANSTNKPQSTAGYSVYGRTPVRQTFRSVADPFNVLLDFNTTLARHPVSQPRYKANTDVPSLRPAMINLDGSTGRSLGVGTYIYCTDCHSNNQARVSKGTGPNGPHGSTYPHLLERRYEVETPPSGGVSYVSGAGGTYALCDKCHDLANSIMQNKSFRYHSMHISSEHASCSTCHAAHGIQGGTATNNKSLINFDTAIVTPNSTTAAMYTSTGTFHGTCNMRCHGEGHNYTY